MPSSTGGGAGCMSKHYNAVLMRHRHHHSRHRPAGLEAEWATVRRDASAVRSGRGWSRPPTRQSVQPAPQSWGGPWPRLARLRRPRAGSPPQCSGACCPRSASPRPRWRAAPPGSLCSSSAILRTPVRLSGRRLREP